MAWTVLSTRWSDVRTDSDADYRAVCKWISDGLTTLGWEKTSDTGQIDLTTATRPGTPSANTKGGYEIRRTTGPATDLYMKITYGLGYNTGCYGAWIQTGEGSDGSGTLTGDTTTERQVAGAVHTASPYEATFYLAGDADNFVMGATQEQTVANGHLYGVQRSCDESGADTNTGWWQYHIGYTSAVAARIQYVGYSTGAALTDDGSLGIFFPPRAVTTTYSGALFLPIFGQTGTVYAPLRDVMGVSPSVLYAQNSVPHYGSTRSYLTVMGNNSANIWGATHPLVVYCGIRIA